MASSLLDVCRWNPTTGGTTDWTYTSAVTGYQSPSAANVVNGAIYSYRAESNDLTQWEVGSGAFNTSTGVLSRTTVLFNSSGTTSKINFSTTPQVAIVALAEDLPRPYYFSASLSANSSSLSSATFTKVQFNTTLADSNGWYDNTTNFRFQPLVAGKYRILSSVEAEGTTSLTELDVDIYKNGSTYARILGLVSGIANTTTISKIVSFNGTTDYVEIWGLVQGTGTLMFLGGTAPIRSWFEAEYVGA